MKNKKGFISISLVYTMFLLLIAMLVYILATYTHNVNVLNVFKEDIITEMESQTTPWDDECTVKSSRLNCKIISGQKLDAQIKSKSALRPLNFALIEEDSGNLYYAYDEKGPVYFYRGKVTNNYVSFAGETWRILRVNGDGSVRLVLNRNMTEVEETALKTTLELSANKEYLNQYNFCSNSINTNQINDLDYTTIFACSYRSTTKSQYLGTLELADVIAAGASTYELKRIKKVILGVEVYALDTDSGNNGYYLHCADDKHCADGDYYYRLRDYVSYVYSRKEEGEIISNEYPGSDLTEYKKPVIILKSKVFVSGGNGTSSSPYRI